LTITILVFTGMYYVARHTLQFLIDKRVLRGGGNIRTSIMAGVFAMLAMMPVFWAI